jgi:SAM-dependent methyltransferase
MLTVDFGRLPLAKGDMVLDAGCGEGRHTFECFRHECAVLGMDLSYQSLLKAVEDDRQGVAELARILTAGGKIAITVPTLLTEHVYDRLSPEYFRTPGGHVRKVVPRRLARSMEENGLRVYAVGFAHAFHFPYWMLRCIFGLHREEATIPSLYRRILYYCLFSKPLRLMEKLCDYFFPKSIILYAQKTVNGKE